MADRLSSDVRNAVIYSSVEAIVGILAGHIEGYKPFPGSEQISEKYYEDLQPRPGNDLKVNWLKYEGVIYDGK